MIWYGLETQTKSVSLNWLFMHSVSSIKFVVSEKSNSDWQKQQKLLRQSCKEHFYHVAIPLHMWFQRRIFLNF
jgi:hypothetical protein